MTKQRKAQLLPRRVFLTHLAISTGLGFVIVVLSLGIGMIGYHYFENLHWIDAFANAAMILSGMGPLTPLQTDSGKLFAGFYALFSGLAFIAIVGIVFAPVVRRFLHKFHLEFDLDK